MGQPLERNIRKLQEFYWSEHDPDGRGFVPLADALRRAGDFIEAHRVLREGLSRHPDFISGHVVAGWLSLDRGRPERAESQFRTALELDPRNIAALRAMGDILLQRGEVVAALDVLERLSHEDPIDLSLPRQIAELRLQAESVPEGDQDEEERDSFQKVWDDPLAVVEELDWASATLQSDESTGKEEKESTGKEQEKPGDAEPSVKESEGRAPSAEEDGPLVEVPLVEDGEPLPGNEGLHGAVLTSTLGEIYLRQGFLDQAEEVFETLLLEDPESVHLQQRLEEVRGLKSMGQGLGEEDPAPMSEEAEESPESSPEGPEDGTSHEGLFKEDLRHSGVVPIESLAPDRVSARKAEDFDSPEPRTEVESGSREALTTAEAIPMDALAPDEPISMDALAPDGPISMDALAPDEPISIDALAPDEPISIDALAPDGPISIDALAPDGPISIDTLAPDGPISIDALAPDEPIAIAALAPDEAASTGVSAPENSQEDSTIADFERWLEGLK